MDSTFALAFKVYLHVEPVETNRIFGIVSQVQVQRINVKGFVETDSLSLVVIVVDPINYLVFLRHGLLDKHGHRGNGRYDLVVNTATTKEETMNARCHTTQV